MLSRYAAILVVVGPGLIVAATLISLPRPIGASIARENGPIEETIELTIRCC